MNRIKRIAISIAVALGFSIPVMVPAMASATSHINSNLCSGADLSFSGNADCTEEGSGAGGQIDNIITTVIDILSLAVGVVSVIMIIIGGFKYITSGGESGSVTGAKNTILYAVVGLVIVALAQIIVKFVLGRVNADPAE